MTIITLEKKQEMILLEQFLEPKGSANYQNFEKNAREIIT